MRPIPGLQERFYIKLIFSPTNLFGYRLDIHLIKLDRQTDTELRVEMNLRSQSGQNVDDWTWDPLKVRTPPRSFWVGYDRWEHPVRALNKVFPDNRIVLEGRLSARSSPRTCGPLCVRLHIYYDELMEDLDALFARGAPLHSETSLHDDPRTVLQPRCPAFAAVLRFDLLQKMRKCVRIVGEESFSHFLLYLHTQGAEEEPLASALGLHPVRDEDALEALRLDCALLLGGDVGAEAVGRALVLAALQTDIALRDRVFRRHGRSLLTCRDDRWVVFALTQGNLAEEALDVRAQGVDGLPTSSRMYSS